MMRAGQYPQGFEAIQWAGSVEMKKKTISLVVVVPVEFIKVCVETKASVLVSRRPAQRIKHLTPAVRIVRD